MARSSLRYIAGTLGLGLLSLAAYAQFSDPGQDVPAYNASAPTRPMPAILAGDKLTGPYFSHSYQVTAYRMAAAIPKVLFQEPCYCHCDRSMGHNSLHSCFEGLHGAECSTCMKEAAYTYRETRRGRTPAQIRAAIERGEFESIDLEHISL